MWDEDGNYTPYEQSLFQIYENGRMIQFANCREDIAKSVEHYENPGPDISSRFDQLKYNHWRLIECLKHFARV